MGFPLKVADRRPKAPEALLLGLLRGVSLPHGGAKCWPDMLALAEAHQVGPLLHAVAPALPAEAREDLRKLRTEAQAARGWQHAALLRVQGALEGTGALVVHAAAHAEDLYPSPELRPLGPLDLLIPPSRTFGALERLSRRGYQIDPSARPEKGWLTLRLRDPRDARAVIHLHRGFPPVGGAIATPQAEVKSALDAEALRARADGTRLHPDDAVLVHAILLAAGGYRDRLISIVDLAHLVRRCDPRAVLARASERGLLPQLGAALLLLQRCAGRSPRFGGAQVDAARIPHLELPRALERAVEDFELTAEPSRPGALAQVARVFRRVAERGPVE